MNHFILVDTRILFFIFVLFSALLIAIVAYSKFWLDERGKVLALKRLLRDYKKRTEELEDILYKQTFYVPEVTTKKRGNKNV